MIESFHTTWGWIAVGICGGAGLLGLGMAALRRSPGRVVNSLMGLAIVSILVQVGAGLILLGRGSEPGGLHVFYGIVILFTLSFAYIYRAQLSKRPALYMGLLMLFLMGLGIRAIQNFGS